MIAAALVCCPHSLHAAWKGTACCNNSRIFIDHSAGFGLKAMCDGRLAGVFIARAKNLGDENLGYDLKFDEEQRKQSAHMEIAMVRKEYRGQGLQRKMMEESEQILKEQGYHYLLGTAHPDNVASVNTFLKLQYEQVMTKEKYGGMKRSIFCKAI